MLVIDREKSNLTWVYKMIDNTEITKVHEVDSIENGEYNHIYVIKHMDQLYIFGGKLGQTYKSYIGFQTNEKELSSYNGDFLKLFMANMEFNFDMEEV